MADSLPSPWTARKPWLWGLWWLILLVATYGLISTQPRDLGSVVIHDKWLMLIASKLVHLTIYSTLSAGACFLCTRLRNRWYFALGLFAHGILTEVIQTYVPGRFGSVMDVCVDTIGIMLGWWLYRKFLVQSA